MFVFSLEGNFKKTIRCTYSWEILNDDSVEVEEKLSLLSFLFPMIKNLEWWKENTLEFNKLNSLAQF